MITIDFLKMAMTTLLTDNVVFYLGNNNSSVITELGSVSIPFSTEIGTDYVEVKTTEAVYFGEGDDTARTVSRINSCEEKKTTPYYSLPLQGTTTISKGYMLKVNPYKENSNGEHIRGIKVKFSMPDTE